MKIKLLLFTVVALSYGAIAQSLNSDSLKKALDNYPRKDSERVIRMAEYANSLKETAPESAIQWYTNAVALAQESGWELPVPFFYMTIAKIQTLQEKYDAGIGNLMTALKIAEDRHLDDLVFDIHFEISETYRLLVNADLARLHAQKALAIATAQKDNRKILWSTFAFANSYVLKNEWDSAAPLLDKAMQLATAQNEEYMRQQIIGLRADRLMQEKKFREALTLYIPNLQFQVAMDNKNGAAWVYAVISMLYADLNVKDSAFLCADSALAIAQRYKLTKELKDAYNAFFYCHSRFGNYKKALEYRLLYDSIYNITYSVAAGQKAERARMELEQERKEAKDKAEALQKDTQAARTRNILYACIGLFAIAALFLFWNNRQKQKAKTAIEKAYDELKLTQQQLIQSEKMASLGELTAGIAHEIQNPLNFVNNFSELNKELTAELKAELTAGNMQLVNEIVSDISENSEKINHHGKRADAIVKGMLQHSRNNSGQKELTDINALCDEYMRLAYHGLRAKDKSFNSNFETHFDNSLQKIDIVPQDIGRVILNLLTNAFYAVNEKQNMANSQQPTTDIYEPSVTISTKKLHDKVEISVSDNGNGIPQNIIDKIFQPFFTTKPTGQGTGLGLSMSYDIVYKGHGGSLTVQSEQGKGTTFIISLPYKTNPTA